jgi:hypothetical protein
MLRAVACALVVDDSASQALHIAAALTRAGYAPVHSAVDWAECQRALARRSLEGEAAARRADGQRRWPGTGRADFTATKMTWRALAEPGRAGSGSASAAKPARRSDAR